MRLTRLHFKTPSGSRRTLMGGLPACGTQTRIDASIFALSLLYAHHYERAPPPHRRYTVQTWQEISVRYVTWVSVTKTRGARITVGVAGYVVVVGNFPCITCLRPSKGSGGSSPDSIDSQPECSLTTYRYFPKPVHLFT
jgi:hypothetical protein